MALRGVRGATTVTRNEREEILDATKELLTRMVEAEQHRPGGHRLGLAHDDIDVFAEFPAVAARQIGWTFIPLMQSHEMNVPGMLPRCIRVLLHVSKIRDPMTSSMSISEVLICSGPTSPHREQPQLLPR